MARAFNHPRICKRRRFSSILSISCLQQIILISTIFVTLCNSLDNVSSSEQNQHEHEDSIEKHAQPQAQESLRRNLITRSVDRHSGPGLCLMMGFPWSGQDFLQRAVHELTRTATAMNYGQAVMSDTGRIILNTADSIPVYTDHINGPFAFSQTLRLPPSGYVLTRTYCAGHCNQCLPDYYVKPPAQHWLECHSGVRFSTKFRGDDGRGNTITYYDKQLPNRYIHLIRSPLTHVAARFEHEFDVWTLQQQFTKIAMYPNGMVGFRKWCKEYDDELYDGHNFELEKSYYLTDPELQRLAKLIPCHSDFYRVVNWHNNAFKNQDSEEMAGKPIKLIYYEDIVANPDIVVDDLLRYLELPKLKMHYSELYEIAHNEPYYDENDMRNIKEYVKRLSDDQTWANLSPYFNEVY